VGDPIALVVGLGNPGPRYEATRHNAGFWFLDALAARAGLRLKEERRFHGALGLWADAGASCRLLKPTTYMNHSGVAVAAVARFFQVPAQQILVVHDDLDLPPGTVRIKRGGGHGGHNGLRDIVARLGANAFLRLRIGIGHPGVRDDVIDYVLSVPRADDRDAMGAGMAAALEVFPLLASGDLERAMHRLHSQGQGRGAVVEGPQRR
jgi:PTH1 family peptidyl-tRNA hydrolase